MSLQPAFAVAAPATVNVTSAATTAVAHYDDDDDEGEEKEEEEEDDDDDDASLPAAGQTGIATVLPSADVRVAAAAAAAPGRRGVDVGGQGDNGAFSEETTTRTTTTTTTTVQVVATFELFDAAGSLVAVANATQSVPAGQQATLRVDAGAPMVVQNAQLWSVARPYLYTLRTTVAEAGGRWVGGWVGR